MGFFILDHAVDSGPFSWLTNFHISQLWNGKGETGVDISLPFHTAITSLTPGVVTGIGYYAGGGVVSVESLVNGQPAEVYYQHLDTINVSKGQAVGPGTLLGLSGGQLSGGAHPSTRQYSTGPHVEVGLNAPYGNMWNPLHLGPNVNPLDWLRGVAQGAASGSLGLGPVPTGFGGLDPTSIAQGIQSGVQGAVGGIGTTIAQKLGATGLSDVLWRSALILGGMVLIVLGILVFFSHEEGSAITVVSQQAGNAAKAAAAAAA